MVGANVQENPRGTRVLKSWVSLLRLEFHFFFLTFFKVPSILLRADLTQPSFSSSRPIGAPAFFLCSSSLRQIVPLFVSVLHLFVRSFPCSSVFFVSSLRLSFFLVAKDQIVHPVAKDQIVHQCSSPTRSPTQHQIVFFDAASSGFVLLQVWQKLSFEDSILLFRTQVYNVAELVHDSSRTRVWKPRFSSSISSF